MEKVGNVRIIINNSLQKEDIFVPHLETIHGLLSSVYLHERSVRGHADPMQ